MENRRIKSGMLMLAMLFSTLSYGAKDSNFLDDTFFRDGKYYVVVLIVSIIFLAIITYLFLLDRKVSRIEKELNNED